MGTILVSRRLPDAGLEPLRGAGHRLVQRTGDQPLSHDELVQALPGVDALLCVLSDRVDEAVLQAGAAGRLQVVATVSVGYDNVDVAAAARLGVTVCHTPGVLDDTTADTAVLLMLGAARLASEAERDLRAGRWPGWGITQYLGLDLHRATLGVVGYGRIGRAVARRASGFAMTVLHHTRSDTGEAGWTASLDELLERADVVSLHVPLTPATHHLIGAAELALMGPRAVLVNTARGAVVDEAALAEALWSGTIFAAGIDVYEHEPAVHPRLLGAPRAMLLPHLASASLATRTAMTTMAAEAVCDVLAGRQPAAVARSRR